MKKRLYVFLVSALGAACLFCSGCGKSEEEQRAEYYENELGLSKSEAQELAKDVQKELNGSVENETYSQGTDAEGNAEEYQRFPKAATWTSLTLGDRAIQIDDVIYYQKPMYVADFIKLVESSSVTYEYEYNPDMLVGAFRGHNSDPTEYYMSEETKDLKILRNGTPWFTASCLNLTGETIPYSELLVMSVSVEEAAKDYCYFLDGRSMDDIRTMKYNEVKDLANTLFADYEMAENASYEDTIKIRFNAKEKTPNPNYVKDGCRMYSYQNEYEFYIDANNSTVINLEWYDKIQYIRTDLYDAVSDFSKLSQEDVKVLTDAGIAAFEKEDITVGVWEKTHNYFDGAQYTPVGMCFELANYGRPTVYAEGIEIQYSDITVIYKIHATDGNDYYAYAYLPYVYRNEKNELMWNQFRFKIEYDHVGDLYTSIEALEEGEYCDFTNMVRLDEE